MTTERVCAMLPSRWGSVGTTGVPFTNLAKLFGVPDRKMRAKLDELAAAGLVEQIDGDRWIARR